MAADDLDVPLAALSVVEVATGSPSARLTSSGNLRGRRKRTEQQDKVDFVVMDFVPGEPDPQQTGQATYKHSAEITKLAKMAKQNDSDVPPIAKQVRHLFVWVAMAGASGPQLVLYTTNPDKMHALQKFEGKGQRSCDICGLPCTETLYAFRCYRRVAPGEIQPQDCRLHPFVAYISKSCGQALLGRRSQAAMFREQLYEWVRRADDHQVQALPLPGGASSLASWTR